jgi:beta-glucuronidase
MLYPRSNRYREVRDLSGIWDFRADEDDSGRAMGWEAGFPDARPIAVPASWNDQLAEARDFLGPAWYSVDFEPGASVPGRTTILRFASVNYIAEAWLNGGFLGAHEGGHLPFWFDVTDRLRAGPNRLVMRVDGRLAPDRVPPGGCETLPPDGFGNITYPPASFDFFPFCGIQRPVSLCALPDARIDDVVVDTRLESTGATMHVRIACAGDGQNVRMLLRGFGSDLRAEADCSAGVAEAEIVVRDPKLWEPGSPALYTLTLEVSKNGKTVDAYSLPVGLRTIRADGEALLLNGRPVYLKGFGRHEDFPVTGRGHVPAVAIKDFALMEWIGANSFRTTHYPYAEETMDLADRLGFLVIDETPAVGLFFLEDGLERRLALCRAYLRELIARDRNHPSVIAWSLANEPHSARPGAREFIRVLSEEAKALDPSRPVTLASYLGEREEAFAFCDIVCLNRYDGWYSQSGRIGDGCAALSRELDAIRAAFHKPVVMTEFGADAMAGCHALESEMFSEEYQSEILERTIAVLRTKPFVVGEQVWNLCDFKTGQEVKRCGGMNLKGVFTRDRKPKAAAQTLRRLWKAG